MAVLFNPQFNIPVTVEIALKDESPFLFAKHGLSFTVTKKFVDGHRDRCFLTLEILEGDILGITAVASPPLQVTTYSNFTHLLSNVPPSGPSSVSVTFYFAFNFKEQRLITENYSISIPVHQLKTLKFGKYVRDRICLQQSGAFECFWSKTLTKDGVVSYQIVIKNKKGVTINGVASDYFITFRANYYKMYSPVNAYMIKFVTDLDILEQEVHPSLPIREETLSSKDTTTSTKPDDDANASNTPPLEADDHVEYLNDSYAEEVWSSDDEFCHDSKETSPEEKLRQQQLSFKEYLNQSSVKNASIHTHPLEIDDNVSYQNDSYAEEVWSSDDEFCHESKETSPKEKLRPQQLSIVEDDWSSDNEVQPQQLAIAPKETLDDDNADALQKMIALEVQHARHTKFLSTEKEKALKECRVEYEKARSELPEQQREEFRQERLQTRQYIPVSQSLLDEAEKIFEARKTTMLKNLQQSFVDILKADEKPNLEDEPHGQEENNSVRTWDAKIDHQYEEATYEAFNVSTTKFESDGWSSEEDEEPYNVTSGPKRTLPNLCDSSSSSDEWSSEDEEITKEVDCNFLEDDDVPEKAHEITFIAADGELIDTDFGSELSPIIDAIFYATPSDECCKIETTFDSLVIVRALILLDGYAIDNIEDDEDQILEFFDKYAITHFENPFF